MKVTIIGCGDAFGSGGRSHTCFRLDQAGRTLIVDFGAGAIIAWNKAGFATSDIDAIIVTHLHGDHFGGLPFLLLQCQFVERRKKPITLFGPPGFKARLMAALEVFFPGTSTMNWTFDWPVVEIIPGQRAEIAGFALQTLAVAHSAGAPATGVRVAAGGRVFAYSGDSAWTESLVELAAGTDLFIIECYSAGRPIPGHIDWPTLDANRARLATRRLMLTHLGQEEGGTELSRTLARLGIETCQDGAIFDL